MTQFSFRAVNPDGRTVTVTCKAADDATARQQLTQRGYRILGGAPTIQVAAPQPGPARSSPRPVRVPRRRWQAPAWWRLLAGALFLVGAAWTVWGVMQSGGGPSRDQARPLTIRLRGVKPRGEGVLTFSFPELPLVVTKPLRELGNPYEFSVELKSRRRPTYGLVKASGAPRRFELQGQEPLTAQVPPPAGAR